MSKTQHYAEVPELEADELDRVTGSSSVSNVIDGIAKSLATTGGASDGTPTVWVARGSRNGGDLPRASGGIQALDGRLART